MRPSDHEACQHDAYRTWRMALAALAIVAFAPAGVTADAGPPSPSSTRVQTTQGWVEGEGADGVSVFRGLAYAAPPVGALRWRAPIATPRWQGVRPAKEFSADCLQKPVLGPDGRPPPDPSPLVTRGRGESEDCLTLNIWTSAPRADAHLPVMVWIHGGGYQFGSGAIAEYDGATFARAGVVLVTLNYRLGALGFLAHPALTAESAYHASGNYGLLDQIAALGWIQHNIAAFGGDPARVTIFGESAGSGSCNILQASPLAKGLFSRVIGESTSQMDASLGLLGRQSRRQAEEYGQHYAASLGARSVDELRKIPVEALQRSDMWFWPLDPDGYVLPESVFDTFQRGHQNDVATLVGSNSSEGNNLRVPWIRLQNAPERAAFARLYGDLQNPQINTDAVAWQMQIWATLQSRRGQRPAYVYRFEQPYPTQGGARAAPDHAAEIIYVFQNFDRAPRAWSDQDRAVGAQMAAYWVNFARSGDPNGAGLPRWPEFQAASPRVMVLGPQTGATPAPRQQAYQLIEDYYARRRAAANARGAGHPSAPNVSGVMNVDLSGNDAAVAASVPVVAVDPKDPLHVVVVWRTIALDETGLQAKQNWVCHFSNSIDGGTTFSDAALEWGLADTPRCNAPFADFGADGSLYVGATVFGSVGHPASLGRAVLRRSNDGGRTWSSAEDVIGTDTQERFAGGLPVPMESQFTPWDGARGVVDKATGRLYVAAGYPAPPGGNEYSQRFYGSSTDGGRTWGRIHSFGSGGWPERWDGHIAADQGQFALTYIGAAVPVGATTSGSVRCPCIVFATGAGDGGDLDRHYVTSIQQLDTLVHYPPLAVNPRKRGAYALALVSDEGAQIVVYSSQNNGADWRSETVPEPPDVVKVSRPALTFTPAGDLVVMWRGEHADHSYDVYLSAGADAGHLQAPRRLTQEPSVIPDGLMTHYAVRGDFINTVTADAKVVHAAWTDWRTGSEARAYYGRAPLASLLAAPH